MKWLTTNIALWLMVGAITSFAAVYIIFGHDNTVEIASGLLLGACVVLAVSWLPTAMIGISKGTRGGAEVLALGLFSMGLFGTIRQAWTQVYRYYDRPVAMLENWTYPLILWSVFWAIFVVIVAPGTSEGEIPTTNKLYLGVASIIGALVAGIAIGNSLRPLAI